MMEMVGMREHQKQWHLWHVRKEGQWEINNREECRDDGDGSRYAVQWRWRFLDISDGIYE